MHVELYGKSEAEDFVWVTSNPFVTDGWSDLCSEDAITDAITDQANADLVTGHELDPKLVREVQAGIWLLVFDEKQMDVTLTPEELKNVMTVLEREGPGLWRG
ncbi:hypothetical protein ASF50_03595 [Nocardioides sp. Leaf307]|nr:hypothetical protein ASF50_03595 [Nocardioides sp. Leaf307]